MSIGPSTVGNGASPVSHGGRGGPEPSARRFGDEAPPLPLPQRRARLRVPLPLPWRPLQLNADDAPLAAEEAKEASERAVDEPSPGKTLLPLLRCAARGSAVAKGEADIFCSTLATLGCLSRSLPGMLPC